MNAAPHRPSPKFFPAACIAFRWFIGSFFCWVGLQKILEPAAQFEAVIAMYQVLPDLLIKPAALAIPWLEFFLGLFLMLGLWTTFVLRGLIAMVLVFLIALIQGQIRGILGADCGCFGEGWHLQPWMTTVLDGVLLVMLLFLHAFRRHTVRWSVDELFSDTGRGS